MTPRQLIGVLGIALGLYALKTGVRAIVEGVTLVLESPIGASAPLETIDRDALARRAEAETN